MSYYSCLLFLFLSIFSEIQSFLLKPLLCCSSQVLCCWRGQNLLSGDLATSNTRQREAVCGKVHWPSGMCSWHYNNNNSNRIQRHNLRFFAISSLRCASSPIRMLKWPGLNCVQITCNTLSAYHMQHVVLGATWYEGTAQLFSLTELKSHLFELYFIGWTIKLWKRGGNWSTRRKSLTMSFRKCYMLKSKDSSPKRNSNLHSGIGGRLGKQMC